MRFISQLHDWLHRTLACRHHGAGMVEGKTYCPDCGHGIVYRWVLLRCGGCGQRRQGQYCFRTILPAQACCTACGDWHVTREILQDPEFFQLRLALLQLEPAEESANPFWASVVTSVNGKVATWQASARTQGIHALLASGSQAG